MCRAGLVWQLSDIPGVKASSCVGFGAMGPGCFGVVMGAGFEAAVEDADEPVRELAQRGVVAKAAVAELVVAGADVGVVQDGCPRRQVGGVDGQAGADEPGVA